VSYTFTIARAKELKADPSLIKEEAKVMQEAFDKQGTQEHSIEMSAHFNTAANTDDMFWKVITEFKLLEDIKNQSK